MVMNDPKVPAWMTWQIMVPFSRVGKSRRNQLAGERRKEWEMMNSVFHRLNLSLEMSYEQQLDRKVLEEIWARDKDLGIDSMEIVFLCVDKMAYGEYIK